jgi:hypothetical protein
VVGKEHPAAFPRKRPQPNGADEMFPRKRAPAHRRMERMERMLLELCGWCWRCLSEDFPHNNIRIILTADFHPGII